MDSKSPTSVAVLEQIAQCESVSASLEPTQAQRYKALKALATFTDWFLDDMHERKTFSLSEPQNNDQFSLGGPPKSLDEVLDLFKNDVIPHGINQAAGGYLGYIPASALHASAVGDFLAAITNVDAAVHFCGPGGVTIEHEVINWMKRVFGYPESSIGNLTSGGSLANMIALICAREKYQISGAKIRRSVVYISQQTHYSISKALRIIGLADIHVRHPKLTPDHKIITSDLESLIQDDISQGLEPFLVVASAGTTDTGAIDPLRMIGCIAEKYGMWYHVDAAYGGFFILTDSVKEKFDGIEMSDSLVSDPHKSLFVPYGLGAVMIKDRACMTKAYTYTDYDANYLQDHIPHDVYPDPADVSPELSKHFRGLRLWLPLQIHGIEPFKACLEEKLLLTRYFRGRLMNAGFKVGPEPDLSVTYFWYEPSSGDQNEFNKNLMAAIHKDGDVFLSSTKLNGMEVIRVAILAQRTKKATIDKCMTMIWRCLHSTIKEIQAPRG